MGGGVTSPREPDADTDWLVGGGAQDQSDTHKLMENEKVGGQIKFCLLFRASYPQRSGLPHDVSFFGRVEAVVSVSQTAAFGSAPSDVSSQNAVSRPAS